MTAVALDPFVVDHVGALRFDQAIDQFIDDMRLESRINSLGTERSYRSILGMHADDVGNRDPRVIGRDQVKQTLARWPNPNTQGTCRSILVSFYRWCMEEGLRKDNPAEQTRRPRRRKSSVYRLTKAESAQMLRAAVTERERWAVSLGVCAGARSKELRGLQGRHFRRPGWLWISPDIGKGGRERWVPLLPELLSIAEDIRRTVADDEYVLPAQRWRDPGENTVRADLKKRPMSAKALWELVGKVGERAGIAAHIHPHLMRHAFADHIARYAGVRNAQFLLGHADIATTQDYLGGPTLDDLADSIRGFSFLEEDERTFFPPGNLPGIPDEATTGIEPVDPGPHALERDTGNEQDGES